MPKRKRVYVRVRCEVDEYGAVSPTAVVWRNGAVYEIAGIRGKCRTPRPGAEHTVRYDVLVGQSVGATRATSVYWDGRRWYVEVD